MGKKQQAHLVHFLTAETRSELPIGTPNLQAIIPGLSVNTISIQLLDLCVACTPAAHNQPELKPLQSIGNTELNHSLQAFYHQTNAAFLSP